MFRLQNFRSTALSLVPVTLLFAAAPGAFAANTAQTNYPAPVAHWLQQAQQDCPGGFQANNPIETLALTGDGRPGFIADPHKLVCAQEPHLFKGDGPASIELFVTLPSGQVVHTGGVLALGYQVMPSPQGGPPTLSFETHESSERTGSLDSYRWDGQNFSILNKQSMAVPPTDGYQ